MYCVNPSRNPPTPKIRKHNETAADTPTLQCPKCGSTIIIELESATKTAAAASVRSSEVSGRSSGSASSTPIGSYNSTGGYMEQAKRPNSTNSSVAPLLKGKSFE